MKKVWIMLHSYETMTQLLSLLTFHGSIIIWFCENMYVRPWWIMHNYRTPLSTGVSLINFYESAASCFTWTAWSSSCLLFSCHVFSLCLPEQLDPQTACWSAVMYFNYLYLNSWILKLPVGQLLYILTIFTWTAGSSGCLLVSCYVVSLSLPEQLDPQDACWSAVMYFHYFYLNS